MDLPSNYTPEAIRDEIEQLVAILAMMVSPAAAAAVLKAIAAEIVSLQPPRN